MSEISSGLVAVAWIAPDEDRFRVRICEDRPTDAPLWSPMCWVSDAEAIIAKLSSKDRYGVCDECGTPYSFDPTDGGTICVKCQKDKIAQKDAEIIEQCRINGIGAEREASLLGQIERQSAALKLAKDALESCDVGDCSIDPMVMPSFDAVAVDEALAAIDALKGE